MRGHEEASGVKYVPKEHLEAWEEKDPLNNFESYLLEEKVLTQDTIEEIRSTFKDQITEGLDIAFDEPEIQSTTERELLDVHKSHEPILIEPKGEKKNVRLIDALSEGLRQS